MTRILRLLAIATVTAAVASAGVWGWKSWKSRARTSIATGPHLKLCPGETGCRLIHDIAGVLPPGDVPRFEQYLGLLRQRGVEPVATELRVVEGPASAAGSSAAPAAPTGPVAYVVQPVLPSSSLAPEVLRRAGPEEAAEVVRGVVEAVGPVVDERTGFDGQLSNWAVVDGELRYLDVSTPMRFDGQGRLELDLDLFLAAYPWLLRAPIKRFVAPGVLGAYRDERHVLVDLLGNLLKERLGHRIPEALAVVNEHVQPTVTEDEVRSYYRSDARLWEVLLRLRRADRWWQRTVRRRDYPFLLPGRIER